MNYKLMLSINYKFFLDNPQTFIDMIKEKDKENVIKGFEFYIDNNNERDVWYIKQIASLCKENGYILNLHSRHYINRESYTKYLEFVDELSKIYGSKINITCHPVEILGKKDNKVESLALSRNIFVDIISKVRMNNFNIDISIENLNCLHGKERLKLGEIEQVLKESKDLKLTHDIGHEIIDDHSYTKLSGMMLDRLSNVHLHNYYGKKDHYPIKKGDLNIDFYKDVNKYLNKTGYDKTVVLEYAADYIEGFDVYEKLSNYIQYVKDFKDIME